MKTSVHLNRSMAFGLILLLVVVCNPLYAQFGDNLGKHKADRALDMNAKNLTNVALLKYKTLDMANLATGGFIGAAAATVDLYTAFQVNQTTAGQTLSLPSPTTPTVGQEAYVKNTGTASFTMYGTTVATGAVIGLSYNGTAWISPTATALGGDISGTVGNASVNKLKNASLTFTGLASNNLLQYNGSAWVNAAPSTLGTIGLLTGTTGTDVNVSGSPATLGSSITLNIPDAATGSRGLVTAGAQTIGGNKTFSGATTLTNTSADPLLLTGTGLTTQPGSLAYSQLVIDNTTGAIRKAPVFNNVGDVISKTVTDPTIAAATAAIGDSWLIPASGATGAWAGLGNYIATWNGTDWGTPRAPVNNDRTIVLSGDDIGKVYCYSSATTSWVQVPVTSSSSLSGLSAANTTNAIDNTNLAQAWNWNTLAAQTALSVGSTATGFTGKLVDISLSGNNVANTGTLLNLNSSGASSIAKTLVSTVASTGALPAAGAVQFNFTGAGHTGTGVGISDVTTTGTALSIAANALTSGKALGISSTTTASTAAGRLLDISASGTNATGTLTTTAASIANTHNGATSTNIGLSVSASGGTSNNYALVVPAGSVGIGTSTPNASALLDVTSTTKGFLPPRMTSAQRDAITPAAGVNGMVVYATDVSTKGPIGLYTVNNSNGTYLWEYLGSKQLTYSAIASSQAITTSSAGAAYTLNATSGNLVITLPAVSTTKGQSIELVRIDNTTNSVQILVSSTSTENICGVTSLYLYGKSEAITLRSDGTSTWYIVSDNRTNNGAVSKSFVSVIANTAQGSIGDTNPIQFNVKEATFGSDITINQGSSPYTSFTLKAGKVYRLYGTPGNAQTISSRLGFQWRQTSGTAAWIGVSGNFIPGPDSYNAPYGSQPAVATISPSSDITVSLCYNQSATGGGSLPSTMNSLNFAAAYIEVISDAASSATPASTRQQAYGTVEYINARLNSDQTVANNAVIPVVTVAGNIPNSSGVFTLVAGKTYRLTASIGGSNSASAANAQWRDIGSGTLIGNIASTLAGNNTTFTDGGQSVAEVIYTPNTNTTVRLENVSGASKVFGGGFNNQTVVSIVQIGTTAVTTCYAQVKNAGTVSFSGTATTIASFTCPQSGIYKITLQLCGSYSSGSNGWVCANLYQGATSIDGSCNICSSNPAFNSYTFLATLTGGLTYDFKAQVGNTATVSVGAGNASLVYELK